jgi:arylsulfatase A-like enzyme
VSSPGGGSLPHVTGATRLTASDQISETALARKENITMRVGWAGCFVIGGLSGALLGALAGLLEYALLLRAGAFTAGVDGSAWKIVLPYTLVGIAIGLASGLAHACVAALRRSAGRTAGSLLAAVVGLWLLLYLVVGATYALGAPLFKLSNVAAYLGSMIVAALVVLAGGRRLGLWMAPLDRPGRFRRMQVILAITVVAVVGLTPFLPDSARGTKMGAVEANTAAARPNIVFILIDTLRADHLKIHGYSRETAPRLTELAQQGTAFTRMYAQSSSTRPSVATLFSSLYPSTHQVHYERDFMPESLTLMAEVLRAGGYRTFAASANANVSPTFGYAQGFDEFRVWKTESPFRLTLLGRTAEDAVGAHRLGTLLRERTDIVPVASAITDMTLDWVARHASERMFLYVQYIDPHDPYRPPTPFDQTFDYTKQPQRRAGGVDPLSLLAPNRNAEDVGRTLDQYDGEILYTDGEMGRLLDRLKALGVLENAIVIVTSDHGEEFYEHGKNSHGRSTYEEVLNVPFVVRWPGKVPAGRTYEATAGLIDVMPTLLELVGLEAPAGIQGVSLAAGLTGSAAPTPRRIFAQVSQDTFAMEMVRDGNEKLVRHTRGPLAGRHELYDLERDPLERADQAARTTARVAALGQYLDALHAVSVHAAARVPAARLKKLDPSTEKALRSLGYIK